MTGFTSYSEINSLDELAFIAGTEQQITFFVWDETNNMVNLTLGSTYWLLAPYGQPDMPVLQIAAVGGTDVNEAIVTVPASDTAALSGKYIQQLLIIDFLGSEFRPCQGIVTIIPQIEEIP